MEGKSISAHICGKDISLGDYVKVMYMTGKRLKGGTIEGNIVEIWTPENGEGLLQARVDSGWCFHDHDEIVIHKPQDKGRKYD